MDDQQCLESFRLFLAALWLGCRRSPTDTTTPVIPGDELAFAKVIDEEICRGCEYAARFNVLGQRGSRMCEDFRRGLSLAGREGLTSTRGHGFCIEMRQRAVAELQAHYHFQDAARIASRYLEEVIEIQ